MRLLVLGGTKFVGRHFVEAALGRRHEVTLFNRGRTAPGLFPGIETIPGDRDGGLGALAGRTWDAVFDPGGYVPRLVAASAAALAGRVGFYAFVSSISVYATPLAPGSDESAPLATLADPTTEVVSGGTYGALKAACEREVVRAFAERALLVRPGLIVGPHDPTDRFGYWPRRLSRGGDVLVPGVPGQPVQLIDARDLAAWSLGMIERGSGGTFNATGPAEPLTFRGLIESAAHALGVTPRLVWVDGGFLLERGVEPWTELPLWVPAGEEGMDEVSVGRARANGLSYRPIADTVRDTLAWDIARPDAAREGSRALRPAREAELLAQWRGRG
ncbi:MAG: epimerase [Candidatus Eisenbacteria bacterium]|nr:epimerase [Candidatus Eisenbacteria bacterium]